MKVTVSASLLALTLTFTLSAAAQGPGRSSGKGKGQALPLQGKALPDVTAYDENGEAFPLKQKLKGRHGVIVFGCLT